MTVEHRTGQGVERVPVVSGIDQCGIDEDAAMPLSDRGMERDMFAYGCPGGVRPAVAGAGENGLAIDRKTPEGGIDLDPFAIGWDPDHLGIDRDPQRRFLADALCSQLAQLIQAIARRP